MGQDIYADMREIIGKRLRGRDAFFMQIGANDGVRSDPIHELIISQPGWKGLFVEPFGPAFEQLKENYDNGQQYIFENVAIGTKAGKQPFFFVSEAAKEIGEWPYWIDQLGTFDREHINRHFGGKLDPYIVEEMVECCTLPQMFEKHSITNVDLLQIDVEGFDFEIVKQIEFDKIRPGIIIFEHQHLSEEAKDSADELLVENGYKVKRYKYDTLAV